ncbi:MAG: dephospho-CoA kinase [Campylobacter sp.]
MSKFQNAYVVTGSIGSGKSTFVTLLCKYGYDVIDADLIAHKQLELSKSEVVAKFGSEILDENGKIDRKKLGNIVFSNGEKLKILESVLHTKIAQDIMKNCEILEAKKKPYFVDIPLYFERLGEYKFKNVVVVYAPKNLLISRIIKRNSLAYDEALRRVELQIDIEEKAKMADFVIDNSQNLENLQHQIRQFLGKISQI